MKKESWSVRVSTYAARLKRYVHQNIYFVAPLCVLLAVYFMWWLAFYPGIMTPDSLDQWGQVLSHNYNNGSPYLSTVIMGMFRFIKDTPAWLGLIQIITTAAVISLGVWYGHKKGVKTWLLAVVVALASTYPTILLFSVTLWKDILYSLFVVLISLLTTIAITEKSENRYLYLFLGIITAMTAVLRYNGIIYLVLPALMLLIFSRKRKQKLSYLLSSTLVAYAFFAFILPNTLHVKSAPMMTEWLRMKTIGAVYHKKDPELTSSERIVFSHVLKEQDWEKYYTCADPDGLALRQENGVRHNYTDYLLPPAQEKAWQKAVVSAAAANPDALVTDRVCMANYFLGRKANITIGISQRADLPLVTESSKLPRVQAHAIRYAYWASTGPLKRLFFMPIGAFSLAFVVAIAAALLQKKRGLFIYGVLNLVNVVFTIAVGFSSDFRYGYSILLATLLLPIMWLADKGPDAPTISKHTTSKRAA